MVTKIDYCALLLEFRHIIHQMKGYSSLYQLIYVS